MVRALASHQCHVDSLLAPRGISLGTPVFPNTNISKLKFDLISEGHMFVGRKTVKCHPH